MVVRGERLTQLPLLRGATTTSNSGLVWVERLQYRFRAVMSYARDCTISLASYYTSKRGNCIGGANVAVDMRPYQSTSLRLSLRARGA